MSNDPQFPNPAEPSPPPPTTEQVKADLSTAAGTLREAAHDARQTAMSDAVEVKNATAAQLSQAAAKARQFAEERKGVAADRIDSVSSAIDRVADELSGDQATASVAGYAHDLAGGIRRVSENVRGNSVDDLVAMVQDFGRRQPAAFLGATALAGFVVGRFVTASAERRRREANAAPGDDLDETARYAGTSGEASSSEEAGVTSGSNGGTFR